MCEISELVFSDITVDVIITFKNFISFWAVVNGKESYEDSFTKGTDIN
jgi:hypothetical protein